MSIPCRCWTEPARYHEGHCCMATADLRCHQDEGMAALAEMERDYMVAEDGPKIERTATLTFTRDCTLCGGDIHVINGERQRHACRLP